MKKLLIILMIPFVSFGQNKIDPIPILTDTTANYDIIDPIQHDFILGWNWGTPGKKLDDALLMNLYHGYPTSGQSSNDDYADSIRVIQNLKGDIIGGRLSDAIFNTQSFYLEPTIKVVRDDSPNEFIPTLRNSNGAIFGFQEKSNELKYINDPLHPDFGKVFLYKDSMTALPKVILDSIWSDDIIRYFNYPGEPIELLPNQNGEKLFISINLKSLDTIPPSIKNDVVLTIKMPYVWYDNDADTIVGSNFIKFANLPKVTSDISDDTLHILGSRGDWRGIRRDTASSLSPIPGIRYFEITAGMLDSDGNGTPDSNITLSAFALLDEIPDGFGGFINNPRLEPDYHEDDSVHFYINKLEMEVTYHGNLDVAIDWIRLETPRAREIFEGKFDNDVYEEAKNVIDELADEPYHGPKLFRFYGADELLPMQWGLNRYYNLLLDTLVNTETTIAKNPPALYNHCLGFKDFWTGDNIQFFVQQGVPYIRHALTRDSTVVDSNSNITHETSTPESNNYLLGYNGRYQRDIDLFGNVNEHYIKPIYDTLDSGYDIYLSRSGDGDTSLPIGATNMIFDSLYGSSAYYPYYKHSPLFNTEYLLQKYYKKQPFMIFGEHPWWANLWVMSSGWDTTNYLGTRSLGQFDKRPKTGEEINMMTFSPIILGAKGLIYWKKTTSESGRSLGLAPNNDTLSYLDSLPTGQELLYSDTIGGDFKIYPDRNLAIDGIDTNNLRLDLFNHDGKRVYVGLKSARTQMYKLHKWITAVDDELMDLRLQAWHGKGYKEWEEWNKYKHYKYWDKSPLRRLVNVDSIRTRKVFQPKWNSNHNYNPGYENRDSSFFDITLLQDKDNRPDDLYNQRKSIYLGIQNRRTDPLIYRDSNYYIPPHGAPLPNPLPTDWRGEIMFFSSAEMDSNVRYGGIDLWGVNQNASWWKDKWWKRFGVRELSIPINIPVYGNGTYVVAEELGLEKMDTLGWWFDDDLYHRIDTSLAGGDKLIAKLLPGQGKIIKLSYVPYFFNDPTEDEDPTNDTCYFCDIYNDFDLFEFNVTPVSEEEGCCYEVSFTYNGDCTFDDIPMRLIFDGYTGNTMVDTNPITSLIDSAGSNIRYKNLIMDLNDSTGTVSLGTYCVSDSVNEYRISLLAGKDKGDRFVGCNREMQFMVKCGEIEEEKDCCENLIVTDSLYTKGTGDTTKYCSTVTIDTSFESNCIYGISIIDSNGYYRTVIPKGFSPIDFTSGIFNVYEFCYEKPACVVATGDSIGRQTMKMQFIGRDGTIICEKEVTLWMPCDYIGIDDIDFTGGPVMKSSKPTEKPDSKTYESDSFKVTVWPNPTSGELNVEIDSKVDTEVDINFISNIGASITNENGVTINKGVNEKTYNLKNYSSGVYYLQINGKDGNIVLPIMLNK